MNGQERVPKAVMHSVINCAYYIMVLLGFVLAASCCFHVAQSFSELLCISRYRQHHVFTNSSLCKLCTPVLAATAPEDARFVTAQNGNRRQQPCKRSGRAALQGWAHLPRAAPPVSWTASRPLQG